MRLILTDKFDLSMFKEYPIELVVAKPYEDEVCIAVENAQDYGYLINMIEDEEVLKRLYSLCGFMVLTKREEGIRFQEFDKVIVVKKEKEGLTFYELLL